ncbi:hypothetical protein OG21DRAFT_1069522 [Imleria badia]|nr:hypothetical protein OG21DRAFT_1069522 [Imleria badia]
MTLKKPRPLHHFLLFDAAVATARSYSPPFQVHEIMSSDIQSALAQIQLSDYNCLVIVTAISYDYCLAFSNEVTYIWVCNRTSLQACASMTPIIAKTLELGVHIVSSLNACCKMSRALTSSPFIRVWSLGGTTFIPGPLKVRHSASVSR